MANKAVTLLSLPEAFPFYQLSEIDTGTTFAYRSFQPETGISRYSTLPVSVGRLDSKANLLCLSSKAPPEKY